MPKILTFLIVSLLIVFVACTNQSNSNNDLDLNDTLNITAVDSLSILSENIKKNPKNPIAWAKRAFYFFNKGNIRDSYIDLQNAVRLDSNNLNYRLKMADIEVAFLNLDEAKVNYEFVLEKDSNNALAYVGIGRIFALVNNPGMATGYLNRAYKIDPHLSEAYFLEGMIYRNDFYETKREESWQRALSSFQTAIEQSPDYYNAYIELGIMHYERGSSLALDYFESAIDLAPQSSEAWYNKGMILQERKNYENAKICYKKIIEFDSAYPNAYYNQGYIFLVHEKLYDSSKYYFEKTILYDDQYYQAYNNLGLSFEYLGEKDSAAKYYRKAIEINPDFKLAKDNLHFVTKK